MGRRVAWRTVIRYPRGGRRASSCVGSLSQRCLACVGHTNLGLALLSHSLRDCNCCTTSITRLNCVPDICSLFCARVRHCAKILDHDQAAVIMHENLSSRLSIR